MDTKERAEMLTRAYLDSYNFAMKEVRNPDFASQIAAAVILVINTCIPKQTINPLELFFADMTSKIQELAEKAESEVDDHD